MNIIPLDKKRFDAFVNQSRSPGASYISEELAWFSTDDESILGIIIRDLMDNDYLALLLGRDEVGAYRNFDISESFENPKDAQDWLFNAMRWHSRDGQKVFLQGDRKKEIDLFSPVVPLEKQHPFYISLRTEDSYLPAREILNHMMPHFIDIDGNFIEQFQSDGFDARLWELYLQSYFVEEELFIEREYQAPDFIVKKYGESVAIEAVIVGRKKNNPARYFRQPEDFFKFVDVAKEHEDAMPIRFGSPLFSKLQKKYWELPHVNGNPLVFAIADFHDDQSMMWSGTALLNYLYGVKHDHHFDKNGRLIISPIQIQKHSVGDKEIPSGYFFQEESENVSAVLFSSSGTLSKFNRMGRQAGFKHPALTMYRLGHMHNHDENANLPDSFKYEVNETCKETWAEGLSMYHNPNAKYPVEEGIFPSVAHHHYKDGQIISLLPEFHPYSSFTLNIKLV